MTVGGARDERGFTLLEALVASAIFAFVMVGAASLFATNGRIYNSGQSGAEIQQNARVALESAVREIRMAGYDHSGVIASLTDKTSVQVGNANSLTFVADVTGEGVLDRVTYQLSGTRFVRDFATWTGGAFPAATSGIIADGISSLTFSYFDATNTAIAAPVASGSLGSIKRITVSLVAMETSAGVQRTFPVVVDVRLRN